MAQRNCSKCGNALQPDDLYCGKCGSLSDLNNVEIEQTESEIPDERVSTHFLRTASPVQPIQLSSSTNCPKCNMRVTPNKDGTCPRCNSIILIKKTGSTSKSNQSTKVNDKHKPPQRSTQTKILTKKQELRNYILKEAGLSRKDLNLLCFIGLFIFGGLQIVAFQMLGKKNHGLFYFIPMIIFALISRFSGNDLWLVSILIYIIGWVHTNIILSGYQSSARYRIKQIDRMSGDKLTVDSVLEKGILQQKVLGTNKAGTSTLLKALQMPGGDAPLLNIAGVAMFQAKKYSYAKQFFSRAQSSEIDDALRSQIERNLTKVEKKLK